MSFASNMFKELRERKLWPIALILIVALVAVPVLLAKKAPTNLVTPELGAGMPYSTGTALPAISVKTVPGNSKLAGKGRNPFTPYHVGKTTTTATVASAPTTTASNTPSTGTGATGSARGQDLPAGGGSTSTTRRPRRRRRRHPRRPLRRSPRRPA